MRNSIRGHHWSFPAHIKRLLRRLVDLDSDLFLQAYSHLGELYYQFFSLLFRFRPPLAGRYLICMPRGGLNDVLCQVKRCMYYAIWHRRTLLLSTEASTLGRIEEIFSFEGLSSVRLFTSSDLPRYLYDLEVWPPMPMASLLKSSCDFGYSSELQGFLTFDFRKSYRYPILFHSGRGGGSGFDLLRHLRARDSIAVKIRKRLSELPPVYDALQIRNSDIKSDYHDLLDAECLRSAGIPLLVCSDDDDAIMYARKALSGVRDVFALRPQRACAGLPFHYDESISIDDRNLAVMQDLFAMAFSRKLFVARMVDGGLSGFSRLAKVLQLRRELAKRILAL